MSAIVLVAVNARYIHASLGLRWLYANLAELQPQTTIQEYCLSHRPVDMAEAILAARPAIVGIGVYIWNADEVRRLVNVLKRVAPATKIVLGGPEVSHLPLRVDFSEADYLLQGEGEHSFRELCRAILTDDPPPERITPAAFVATGTLIQPYQFYTCQDLAHRLVYVEASRGCPFACAFCLSSIDRRIRPFPLDSFLAELESLWARGARTFKFVDRTFNANPVAAARILDFFLAKQPPFHVHFEVVPDHFPDKLKDRLVRFPPGVMQLEIGIQTLDARTAATVNRQIDIHRIHENLTFLEQRTNAHLHLDLIVGLPGEPLDRFGAHLNTLVALTSGEIQIGILKKLSGTAIGQHDREYGMVYSADPPYEILCNNVITFGEMQEMKRLARFWDLVYNSGNCKRTAPLLWPDGDVFRGFRAFCAWIYARTGATWQIGLPRLAGLLFDYLATETGMDKAEVADGLAADILAIKGRVLPPSVMAHVARLPDEHRTLGDTRIRRQNKRRM